jgi:hypothetical protein
MHTSIQTDTYMIYTHQTDRKEDRQTDRQIYRQKESHSYTEDISTWSKASAQAPYIDT